MLNSGACPYSHLVSLRVAACCLCSRSQGRWLRATWRPSNTRSASGDTRSGWHQGGHRRSRSPADPPNRRTVPRCRQARDLRSLLGKSGPLTRRRVRPRQAARRDRRRPARGTLGCRGLLSPWFVITTKTGTAQAIPIGSPAKTSVAAARVLAIADCYDAMTSDRPYRRAMASHSGAGDDVRRRGSMFDPQMTRRVPSRSCRRCDRCLPDARPAIRASLRRAAVARSKRARDEDRRLRGRSDLLGAAAKARAYIAMVVVAGTAASVLALTHCSCSGRSCSAC